jgi:GH15 family glucan-1,4-alpha-glucosidase
VRQDGGDSLDSSAAWAVTVFPKPALRSAARRTLLALTRESTPYGIPPMEGWSPGEVWTAPTAWSAWGLVELGRIGAADRLLGELRRAATPDGMLPERVDARTGEATSTTPLAWSHAFAILALRARYG